MNTTITQDVAGESTSRSTVKETISNDCSAPISPALDAIVRAICLDARHDSMKFILRSDTGHDGE